MPRLLAAGVALGAAVAAALFWPTDARRIRATLAAAAEAVSSRAGEAELERVARAAGLARTLAAEVVVEAGPDGPAVRGRETVVGLASRLRMQGPLSVEFDGVQLAIDGEAATATAQAFARVRGGSAAEAGGYDGVEVRIDLAKVDGAWLITRVAPERTLTP
jgi:hypothetical protein